MKILICLLALFTSNCLSATADMDKSNSPQAMAKREAIRKALCNKHHYPDVKFIRVGGKLEIYKIHAELSEKTAYECKF